MGSATRDATAASRAALAADRGTVDLALAEELFVAGRTIGSSLQLRNLLSEPSGDPEGKSAAIKAVFAGSLSRTAVALLGTVATRRWSSTDDLLGGIEDLGLRTVADAAPEGADIEGELFAFGRTVVSSPELELAIGSKLGDPASKAALVTSLLKGTASAEALTIIRHLVQQPRGRRIGRLISDAAATVADQTGYAIATVTTAKPLGAEQQARLQRAISSRFGRQVKLNVMVDPALIGGVRVQLGDDIIDGSVATRIADLRLQLAG